MHTDREMTRVVRSWMEEGATALPDRVLDAVLDQIPATPQRRLVWPTRRLTDMNSAFKVAVAVAAVLVVALVGYNVIPGIHVPDGPAQTTAATLAPTSSPSAIPAAPIGRLDPGTYIVTGTAVPFTFAVPAGWLRRGDGYISKNEDQPGQLAFRPFNLTHVYTDACASRGTLTEIGPTADDLVGALLNQTGSDASTPVDLEIGGYPATRIDMSVPADLDTSECRHPDTLIQVWADAAEREYFAISVKSPGENRVYSVDVDGERAVFLVGISPESPLSDVGELDAILESIIFVP